MTEETYIALIQKDIRELSLIAEGLNETGFPTPTVIRLASDKAVDIVNNLQRLSEYKQQREATIAEEEERKRQQLIAEQEKQKQTPHSTSSHTQKTLIDRTEIRPTKTESVIGTRETKVERIISQNKKALADRMANTKIESLRKAISMGDRFRFQRELFDNNAETMNAAIDSIDACSDIYAAEDFINDHFDWDPENETVRDFLILLSRRF